MGRSLRTHIGIFGRRNNGKSSLINYIADQSIAIVSEHAGTTTDPVRKALEIFGVGPSVLIDTAGIDDEGDLGKKRIAKSIKTIKIIDLAILVITDNQFGEYEEKLIKEFNRFATPFFIVHNKSDISPLKEDVKSSLTAEFKTDVIDITLTGARDIEKLVELIVKHTPETAYTRPSLLGDVIEEDDIIVLVCPIDSEAPEGRMILPQVQAIRDVLDNDAISVVLKVEQLKPYLDSTNKKPKLVVTDSQAFGEVSKIVPSDIMLTSFSIVFARYKGDFEEFLKGTPKLAELKENDKVLILESCTHQVSCDDIGRVKIPNWLKKYTGTKDIHFEVVSGLDDLPDDLNTYALVIQCGGCVITQKQVKNRMKPAIECGVPVTNYGMAISYIHGIFDRVVEPFNF